MTDTAIRTLEYEAGLRDQELANLRLRVAQLESAAGFVVRRVELATSESLRERIEALRNVLDDATDATNAPFELDEVLNELIKRWEAPWQAFDEDAFGAAIQRLKILRGVR